MTQEQLDSMIATGRLKRLEKFSCNVPDKPKYLVLSFTDPYWTIDLFDSAGVCTMDTEHYTDHTGVYNSFEAHLNSYNRKFVELFERGSFSPVNPISTQVLKELRWSHGA